MQIDMHYYGTYALARAAGLRTDICSLIATASQFVDDNAFGGNIEMLDGARIDSEATAHHVADASNINRSDQRQVWVPFHFLPGNEGGSFSERLLCRKDSEIAREMVEHHLANAAEDTGPYLIGIAAHVYADTFSHYGFSGVGSRRNRIVNDSIQYEIELKERIYKYLRTKEERFFKRFYQEAGLIANVKSWLAETFSGALGHGAVATYPDRPYLKWSFEYEYPKQQRVVRDNPGTFLEAAAALHRMFSEYGSRTPSVDQGDGVAFSEVEDSVRTIIGTQGTKSERIEQWAEYAEGGKLGQARFTIPPYQPEKWLKSSVTLAAIEDSKDALEDPLYLFFRAASLHRHYVLRQLLPAHGLVVA